MWHGLIVDIPNGWALCDGTNGTPDLREKFVRGAEDGIDPGSEGGDTEHFHVSTGFSEYANLPHSHTVDITSLPVNYDNNDVTDTEGGVEEYSEHTHDLYGTTETGGQYHKHDNTLSSNYQEHLPPYYDILFIMKL